MLGPESAVRRFIDLANMGGGRDNITAVVVTVGPQESEETLGFSRSSRPPFADEGGD